VNEVKQSKNGVKFIDRIDGGNFRTSKERRIIMFPYSSFDYNSFIISKKTDL